MLEPDKSPKEAGYFFPAEWEKHSVTWLSFPHNENSWPGKIQSIYPIYFRFIQTLAEAEAVHINVLDEKMKNWATAELEKMDANLTQIYFHLHPTNDAWCRDHGPAFLINPKAEIKKIIVNWGYNAWGEKYPPYHLDNEIPVKIAQYLQLPFVSPGIVMEGGSVDFNGSGTVLTTSACLLNKNRNPHKSKIEIEKYLVNYYGVDQILWLGEGIVGDDTDGHIDDITRFTDAETVVTVIEHKQSDENFEILKKNLKELTRMRLLNGKQLNIVEIPMPDPVVYEEQRLPASYANFYIANQSVIVPTFRCKQDEEALDILQKCFPGRQIIGLDSVDLIWGLGSFHCLSQQEPAI